jgi:hypothetical protein
MVRSFLCSKGIMLTQELLHERLEYRDDGNLYWKVKVPRSQVKVGAIAGYIKRASNRKGETRFYRFVSIGKVRYRAHRLVWFYHHGVWPSELLDHKDGNGLNNRLDNLREATHSTNAFNTGISANNTSGYKGVSYNRKANRYHAYIYINRKYKHLGCYTTAEEASKVYEANARELHGEFYYEAG